MFVTKPLPFAVFSARTQTLTVPHVVRRGKMSLTTTAFQRGFIMWVTMVPVSSFIITSKPFGLELFVEGERANGINERFAQLWEGHHDGGEERVFLS